MKVIAQNNQFTFDFNSAVETSTVTSTPLIIAAMQNLADRLHTKLDLMLNQDLDKQVSVTIRPDDQAMFAEALQCSNDAPPLLTELAREIMELTPEANAKVAKLYLSYERTEALFNCL